MLSLAARWPERRTCGAQRLFLNSDGTKAGVAPERMALGSLAGAAVRLGQVGDTLAISEGIETGAAFGQMRDVPVWAAISAAGMTAVILPDLPLAKTLIIAADADGAGLAAAAKLAGRAEAEGRRVFIEVPRAWGSDWNDALRDGALA